LGGKGGNLQFEFKFEKFWMEFGFWEFEGIYNLNLVEILLRTQPVVQVAWECTLECHPLAVLTIGSSALQRPRKSAMHCVPRTHAPRSLLLQLRAASERHPLDCVGPWAELFQRLDFPLDLPAPADRSLPRAEARWRRWLSVYSRDVLLAAETADALLQGEDLTSCPAGVVCAYLVRLLAFVGRDRGQWVATLIGGASYVTALIAQPLAALMLTPWPVVELWALASTFSEPWDPAFPLGPAFAEPRSPAAAYAFVALHGAPSPLRPLLGSPVAGRVVYVTGAWGERYRALLEPFLANLASELVWVLGDAETCATCACACAVLESWHAAWKYAALAAAVQLGAAAVWVDADSLILRPLTIDWSSSAVLVAAHLGELSPFAVAAAPCASASTRAAASSAFVGRNNPEPHGNSN